MKKHQTNTAVGKPYGNVDVVNQGTELEYMKGSYNIDYGTVMFYAERKFASFSFVYNGRLHGLSLSEIKKPLTKKQLIIWAGKFGREVVSNFK